MFVLFETNKPFYVKNDILMTSAVILRGCVGAYSWEVGPNFTRQVTPIQEHTRKVWLSDPNPVLETIYNIYITNWNYYEKQI